MDAVSVCSARFEQSIDLETCADAADAAHVAKHTQRASRVKEHRSTYSFFPENQF
jgi:hypothetical protein